MTWRARRCACTSGHGPFADRGIRLWALTACQIASSAGVRTVTRPNHVWATDIRLHHHVHPDGAASRNSSP